MSEGHQYTDELRSVKDDIKDLSENFTRYVASQQEHNNEIKQLLAGSEYGEDGLVKKQIKLEERVEELEELKSKIVGYAIGISAGTGGAVAGIVKLLGG